MVMITLILMIEMVVIRHAHVTECLLKSLVKFCHSDKVPRFVVERHLYQDLG